MKCIKDFEFSLSVSREGYSSKEECSLCLERAGAKSIGREKMAFKEELLTIDKMIDYACTGHSFCGLFDFEDKNYWFESGGKKTKRNPYYKRGLNKGCFKLDFKSDRFYRGSQVIFVDIDKTVYESLLSYISVLRYKPTSSYLSFSDKLEKSGVVSRRFRLVYVFDEVLNYQEFCSISSELYKYIELDTGEEIDDNCGKNASQYMNGGKTKAESFTTNFIYSKSDFNCSIEVPFNEVHYIEDYEMPEPVVFDQELLYDMTYLNYEYVVRKWYNKGLRYIWHSEVDFSVHGYYAMTDADYCSLYYCKNKILDGSMRRRKLFIRAALRCLMKEGITADELLYNLYIDRERFFDNSDNVLTIEALMQRVVNALNTTEDDIKFYLNTYKRPQFVINPELSGRRLLVAKARKDISDDRIGSNYDVSKSVKENYDILNGAGIKVSKTRLYDFCREKGISTKPKALDIEALYNPNLSIRENMKNIGCTKYQIEKYLKRVDKESIG